MAITLRATKGSALTHTELDTNFSDLDAETTSLDSRTSSLEGAVDGINQGVGGVLTLLNIDLENDTDISGMIERIFDMSQQVNITTNLTLSTPSPHWIWFKADATYIGDAAQMSIEDTNGDIILAASGTNNNAIQMNYVNIRMPNLPTSDPVEAGRLWNDSGTLKISAG